MKIGIISDTHNTFHPNIAKIFKNLPYIIHAGDIGRGEILSRLQAIPGVQKVYAVLGNTDSPWELPDIPLRLDLEIEGHRIWVQHIIESPPSFYRTLAREEKEMPEVIIFGHTHQPYLKRMNETYFINPGSATSPRGGFNPSVAILSFEANRPQATIIDLAS